MILCAIAFLSSAVVAWLAIYPLRDRLARAHVLDVPNERSSHAAPTPRGGGLAIVLSVLIGELGVAYFLSGALDGRLLALAGSAGFVAALSWVDDVRTLSSGVRLVGHGAAAATVIWFLGPVSAIEVPGVGMLVLGHAAVPLTALWIVGLTNAYNFMDGVDGIAGLQGLVAGLAWTDLALQTSSPIGAAAGALIAGGCLGFLAHNWHPARIFMGDVGSAFLGFTFATLPLLVGGTRRAMEGLSAGALSVAAVAFVWPFVFDTVLTFLARCSRGENVLQAHRSHLYQRRVKLGASHARVALLYAAMAGAGVAGVEAWMRFGPRAGAAILASIPLMAACLWSSTVLRERARRTSALPGQE